MRSILIATAAMVCCAPLSAFASTSVFQTAPDDPQAVTVHGVGDGHADDTAAIQRAIDEAAKQKNGGIVFVPSGRYRLTRSVFVWPAVRIFGVGRTRPVFVLADNTPGFQQGVKTLFVFTGQDQYSVGQVPFAPPSAQPFNPKIWDATSSTFYSAMANVDFEIGAGDPAAAGVRFRVAQHGYLNHIDFHLGSGFAGIYQAGNICHDLHFYGGRYGIVSEKTSPAWQFTLADATFDGQREAAIREHEVDLTLVNTTIRNTPVGIDVDQGYSDSLWGKDVRFENVAKAGVIISNETSAFTQIGFDNALASATPVFARFRDSGRTVPGRGRAYRVKSFDFGLKVPGLGAMGKTDLAVDAEPLRALPPPKPLAIRGLPPVSEWVSVKRFGAKGDDQTDDTAAIQKAIDSARVVYFPLGDYRITDTLRLKPDTVLIGLHPNRTEIVLPDETPAFAGVGAPKPMIETAGGGDAVISGFGLFAGGINPRAFNLLWRAGEGSLLEDVKIQGGHGSPRNSANMPDISNVRYRWDAEYPSIWVTDGGGGTFDDIWTPNTFATAGFYVTDTHTPGHVYELSNEHHVRNEIVLDNVENWEFLAPQTEEEARESQDTVSLEIRNSHHLLFANYHAYRVTRSVKPAATAVRLFNSGDIRIRNMTANGESGFATCDENGCATYARASKFPFEDAVDDMTHKLAVRERLFAVLDIPADPPAPPPTPTPPNLSGKVEKLEDGFYSISGGAVDAAGKLYFVDHHDQRIMSWSRARGLEVVRDNALDPVNLAIDASGDLVVLSSDGPQGTVYSFKPGAQDGHLTLLKPSPIADHPRATIALPVNTWVNGEFKDQLDPKTYRFTTLQEMYLRDAGQPKAQAYVSPDGSLVLPAFRVYRQGPPTYSGYRFSDTLDTYGFVTGKPGQRVFVVNGSEDRTYSGIIGPAGQLTDLKVFAERGGESVTTDAAGNVYVANGQVFVYAPDGRELGRIDVPERPLQLLVGGEDHHTLFILAHHALYAARI